MWKAVVQAAVGSSSSSIGKALQKQGTRGLPRLSLTFKVLQHYLSSRTWVSGIIIDIFGGVLMVKAVAEAPLSMNRSLAGPQIGQPGSVSIIQPVSGCGMAVLALFSHCYLQEEMHGLDWIGVTMTIIGTVCVGMVGETQIESNISPVRLLLFVCAFTLIIGLLERWLVHFQRQRRHGYDSLGSPTSELSMLSHLEVMEELIAGTEAGILFGLAAAFCKLGFNLAVNGFPTFCILIGLGVGMACSSCGFFFQTKGLKEGRAVIISTCAAVASMLVGVIVGIFALGESLPTARKLLFIGWSLILMGVVVLLASSGALPSSVRQSSHLKGLQHKANIARRGSSRYRP